MRRSANYIDPGVELWRVESLTLSYLGKTHVCFGEFSGALASRELQDRIGPWPETARISPNETEFR
jgi:hypothetical protein